MTEKEMLGTLQLVWDNMYHLLHDDLQCPYPVRKYEINEGGVFDF